MKRSLRLWNDRKHLIEIKLGLFLRSNRDDYKLMQSIFHLNGSTGDYLIKYLQIIYMK